MCARVKLSKRIVNPHDNKVMIPGYAVGVNDTTVNNIVETFQFLQRKGLFVARTLVNSEDIQFSVANINISSKPNQLDLKNIVLQHYNL